MIETVRISPTAKDQLIALKRRTGLKHNNELCRWALCRSLAEPSQPPEIPLKTDGGISIEWRIFGGRLAELYLDLICQRCIRNGLEVDPQTVNCQLHLHLHRGIGYLFGERASGHAADLERRRRGSGVRELARVALAVPSSHVADDG